MKRREFITLLGGAAAAWPVAARAQQFKVHRIGLLALTDADAQSFGRGLREGLGELGVIEGQNYTVEGRSAEGDANLLPELAAELVRRKVDIIAALFTPCALAAKQATSVIPIVFAAAGDPLGTGLVTNLARPGGNITGLSNMAAETAGKSVELLRDMLPSLSRVALLVNPLDPFTKSIVEHVQLAGRTAGIQIAPVAMARGVDEAEAAFATIAQARAEAVVVQGIFFSRTFADLAIRYRLPSASVVRAFVDAGGLMTYGASIPTMYRRSAVLVHKIMQGTRPADLPVEQPTKFELAINLKSAKAMGLTIPESFLLRADEVIE